MLNRLLWCLHRDGADLLQQAEQIGLAMLFDELPLRQTINVHGLDFDSRACWRHTMEGALVRAPHGEACSYLVAFGNHLLQSPLDVREPRSHHRDDRKVTSRTSQRLGVSRDMEDCARRDQLRGQLL